MSKRHSSRCVRNGSVVFCAEELESRRLLSQAVGPVVFQDEFTGRALNTRKWTAVSGDSEDKRTSFSDSAACVRQAGGVAHLKFNTHNSEYWAYNWAPEFLGSRLVSKPTFQVAGDQGVSVSVRARLQAPVRGGVVAKFGLEKIDSTYERIETTLTTNDVVGKTSIVRAYSVDYSFAGLGEAVVALPNQGSLSKFHTYTMTAFPDRIQWDVDGSLVHMETMEVPTGPMRLALSFYAPNEGSAGYNNRLKPARLPQRNIRMVCDIDRVEVKTVPMPGPKPYAFAVYYVEAKADAQSVWQDDPITLNATAIGQGDGSVDYEWRVERNGTTVFDAAKADSSQWPGSKGTITVTDGNGVAGLSFPLAKLTFMPGNYRAFVHYKAGGRYAGEWDGVACEFTVVARQPSITITSVPPYGKSGYANGDMTGDPAAYEGVAVFIRVGSGWWTKPYWNSPVTKINLTNGEWSTDIDTGGYDENASLVRAYLIPKGFAVPLAGGGSLPTSLTGLLYTEVKRR